jgi:hypothetical protein
VKVTVTHQSELLMKVLMECGSAALAPALDIVTATLLENSAYYSISVV